MSSFLVITYDVTNPERFADYNPGSLGGIFETVAKHGGELVFAGAPDLVKGNATNASVCIKFPDGDAAKAWLDDAEYAPMKAIRMESTSNTTEYVVSGPA